MCAMRVMPVNDDILKTKVDPRKVIALYGDFAGTINVGYPAIAAYKPILGNMWGYKEAQDKGLYIIIDDDNNLLITSDTYEIEIDEERNVLTKFNKVNIKSETPIYNFNKKKKRAL